jgi:signal transduction histidine kinase
MTWLRRRLNSVGTQITVLLALASLMSIAIMTLIFLIAVARAAGDGNARQAEPGAQAGAAIRALGNLTPTRRTELIAAFQDDGFTVRLLTAIPDIGPMPGLDGLVQKFQVENNLPPGAELVGIEAAGPSKIRIIALLKDGQPVAIEAPPRSLFRLPGALLLVLLSLFVSTTLLSIWAARRLVAPLGRFAAAVDRFGAEAGGTPLEEEGPVEIRQATRAFNQMRDRIVKLIGDRTRMLMAISHDLRTPLTRLRLRAEDLPEGVERDKMLDDVRQMDASIGAAVAFLREGATADIPVRADLASLLETICDQFSDMGYVVHYRGPERMPIQCQPTALSRAVTNLVDNATKYGTSVVVSLMLVGSGQVMIEVADDGPGISDSEKARVFEPFYRSDAARQNVTGFGLGLAIAVVVAQNHGGTLSLHDRKPHGLRARLCLPFTPVG